MTFCIRRREFIAGAVGAAAAWPLAARAQQPAKLPTIGYLGAATPLAWGQWTAAFVQRLRELGWVEGRTVAIEYRWGEGRNDRFAEIAAEFVRLKVDVVVTAGTAAALAAKQATSAIPIVFATAGNPVETSLVASLARPGGNVTGLSNQAVDIIAKRLQLLREAVPGLDRLAIPANTGSPLGVLQMGEAQEAARKLGLEAVTLEIKGPRDIESAFAGLNGRAQALYVVNESVIFTRRVAINTFALAAHLPTMHDIREHVEVGGLLSYGPNFPDLYRRAAELVDKILRGAKPADIPVEQPTNFDLVINLTTAKVLGLAIPPTLRALATELIE
jgi:ABC-type uncharacterized transport system substrate-binding protein